LLFLDGRAGLALLGVAELGCVIEGLGEEFFFLVDKGTDPEVTKLKLPG
jgi:hypothetical protein